MIKGKYMSAVTGGRETSASSKIPSSFAGISKETLIERVKKLAMPILIVTGLLLADIGAAFLGASLPVIGGTIATSAIGLIAYAIIKIKGAKSETTQESNTVDLKQKKAIALHDKKAFCYKKLTIDDPVDEKVDFTKVNLSKKEKEKIANQSLFINSKTNIASKEGPFSYDKSTEKNEHWTANFADKDLFGYAHTNLLAQDELQVLEHPGMYHLINALSSDSKSLNNDDIALVKGVKRKGELKNIYGNQFQAASEKVIDENLTKIENPHESNIFAIVAPKAKASDQNKPYTKSDLEKLFYRALNAFEAIKKQAKGKEVTIHTGNWGAGAFGGSVKVAALCQMVAAKKANVDNFIFYPMDKKQDFEEAEKIFEKIQKENKDMKVDEFLDYLHQNAKSFNLLYGASNNT